VKTPAENAAAEKCAAALLECYVESQQPGDKAALELPGWNLATAISRACMAAEVEYLQARDRCYIFTVNPALPAERQAKDYTELLYAARVWHGRWEQLLSAAVHLANGAQIPPQET
jgi:hypothetical protein